MKVVISSARRSSAALEIGLLAACVVLGSAITVFAFGGEVADAYGSAAARLPHGSRGTVMAARAIHTPPTLEPRALAVQRALFGVELADLLEDGDRR